MPAWEEALAFKHAPVLLQKVHSRYKRADFITRVDFAYRWDNVYKNWGAAWEEKNGGYKHKLKAHGYYSVVATHTHYYIVYAFYHPQDWTAFWGNPARSKPDQPGQHLHDMEGCLAVVPRRTNTDDERAEAIITISHYHFFSYAGWEKDDERIEGDYLIQGWTEDLDGPIRVTERFAGRRNEPPYRLKLYADSGGHAIKGARRGWGSENRIVRYQPTLGRAGEPDEDGFERETDAYFQTVRYKLLPIFSPGGLWAQHEDRRVFQPNEKGQESFVERDERGEFVAGSANPPWGWDDAADRHRAGDFAWDPAHLVSDYFTGLRGFSRTYLHNPYIGLVSP